MKRRTSVDNITAVILKLEFGFPSEYRGKELATVLGFFTIFNDFYAIISLLTSILMIMNLNL